MEIGTNASVTKRNAVKIVCHRNDLADRIIEIIFVWLICCRFRDFGLKPYLLDVTPKNFIFDELSALL